MDQARAKCINNALDSESSSCDCGNRFFFVYFVVQLKDQLPIWRRDFSRFLRMRGNNVNEIKHQVNGMHFWKCKQPVSQGALSRKTHDIIERVLWKRGERCMSDLGQEHFRRRGQWCRKCMQVQKMEIRDVQEVLHLQ